jgi:RNA polymerase sigma-70 factor, ECF subfamily
VDHRLPQLSQQATLRSLGDARLRAIVDRYVQAWERHDVDAIAAMLTDSATLAMPPTATWFRGRDAVTAGLRAFPLHGALTWRLTPTRANGQLAALAHVRDAKADRFAAHHTAVLTLRGGLIAEINAFHHPPAPAGAPIEPGVAADRADARPGFET